MFLCILEMVNAMLNRRSSAGLRPERAVSPVLEGIRREDWQARPDTARRLGAVLAERGEVAYWVVAPDRGSRRNGRDEQRASAREQMRLRSAKLLDAAFRFMCECRICDRSLHGMRLALARNIRLPRRISVHIDETGEVRSAKVVWRQKLVIGVRLHERAPAIALRPWDRFALRERYYGILD
jgi:PilZ domain